MNKIRAISNRFFGMILPLFLRRLLHRHLRRAQHILNENTVACGRSVDKDMGDGTDELAVLDNGRAAHECGQEGTTLFNEKFTNTAESNQTVTLGGNVIQVDF